MLDAYRDLIDELLGTPSAIRGMIETDGGGVASRDVSVLIAGLRDRDKAVLDRIQTVTRQDAPYLRAWRDEKAETDEELPVILEALETARGELVSLLMNLSLKDWERKAVHEIDGEITLADEVERHVEFDEEARRRLRELMA